MCVLGRFTIPCCEVVSASAAFTVSPSTGVCRVAFILRCILDPVFPPGGGGVSVEWTGDVCGVCHTATQRCSCPRGESRGVVRAVAQQGVNGQRGASSSAGGAAGPRTPRRAWSRDVLRAGGSDLGADVQGASQGARAADAPMFQSPATPHFGGAVRGNAGDRGSGRRDRSRDRVRPVREGGRPGQQERSGINLASSFENMRVGDRLEHCPVVGCCASAGRGHPGMGKAALKNHIDTHLLGITQGQVPAQWLTEKGWSVCQHCSRTAATNRNGGNHEGCVARARAMQGNGEVDEWGHFEDGWEAGGWAARLRKLPNFSDIFVSLACTREYTHRALLTAYRQEFGMLCANVVRYNRMDAWDFLAPYGGETDTPEMKRCRVAWTEWAMFAKCVLQAESRGVRPAQPLSRARCRLEQWCGGSGRAYGTRLC